MSSRTRCFVLAVPVTLGLTLCSSLEPTASASPVVVEIGVTGAFNALNSGAASSVELTQAYLDRIAAYDGPYDDQPGLHAIIALNPNAIETARNLDRERASGHVRGPLHGVPIIVKDNIDIAGMPTTNGAIALAEYRPLRNATVVTKLIAAGAIVLAKSNLSELAWSGDDSVSSVAGEVHNPYNQSRTASGSSGGSAAAVAASLAAAALGTDTFGSIRTPAAHQSLVGVRPTHGLISLRGVTPQVAGQDTVGPLALTVKDAALLLEVMAGYDPHDPWTHQTPKQVNFTRALTTHSLQSTTLIHLVLPDGLTRPAELMDDHAEVVAVFHRGLDMLRTEGATIVDVEISEEQLARLSGWEWYGMAGWLDRYWARNPASWPRGLAALTEPFDVLSTSDYLADGRALPSIAESSEWLLEGSPLDRDQVRAMSSARVAALRTWNALLDSYGASAVVLPTDTLPASTAPITYENERNARLPSTLGVPGISVPIGFTRKGLPVGLQLTGKRNSDAQLLAYAFDFEQATHHRKPPPTTP